MPYDSHIPALIEIARRRPIRTVVEYGSGRFSTPLFLDRDYFPLVERVVSYENDPEWWLDTFLRCRDRRLYLHACRLDCMRFCLHREIDLVFIDCDAGPGDGNYKPRVELLNRYAETDAVVVLHDIHHQPLRAPIRAAAYRFKTEWEGHTGIFTNRSIIRR